MKAIGIVLVAVLFGGAEACCQVADVPRYRSFFKLNLMSAGISIASPDWYWAGIQYERSIVGDKKFTIAVSIDYLRPKHFNSYPLPGFESSKNLMLIVRPQARYYLGKQALRGSYVGLFPLYHHIDYPYHKGDKWGGGFVTGYQFLIAGKIPLDVSAWIAHEAGDILQFGENDYLETMHESGLIGILDINIGLPLGKKS